MLVFHCGCYQGVVLTAGQHYYEKRAVGRRGLPGDLFKTQRRRTALLDLWKTSLPKCLRATVPNLQTLAFSLKLTGFYSSHNKKPSSPWDSSFYPPPPLWVLPCWDRSVGVSDKPYMKGPLNPFTRCGLAAAWCVVTDAGSQTPLLPLLCRQRRGEWEGVKSLRQSGSSKKPQLGALILSTATPMSLENTSIWNHTFHR